MFSLTHRESNGKSGVFLEKRTTIGGKEAVYLKIVSAYLKIVKKKQKFLGLGSAGIY